MSKYYRIDGHGHMLPYPEEIPAFMKEKGIFWIDEDRTHMRTRDWKRPVTDDSAFLDEKIAWLKNNDIDHEVILNLSQLYCNCMEEQLCYDVLRFQNDYNAKVQAENGRYFTTGFVVQPAHMDMALKEMDRCVNERGMSLLCLPTHFCDSSGQWRSVAEQAAEPIFEYANELGIAIEIHPYDGQKMVALEDHYWRFHLVWMCAQTADTYHYFTLRDYPDKYPNVRTCFAHGNQFAQVNVGRRIQGFEGRPDLFPGAVHPRKTIGAKNVFFDTLVHDIYSLELLIRRQGVSQIIAGIDDPYPLGEMDTVQNSYPGKVIDDAVGSEIISSADRKKIWGENILNWLAGDDQEAIRKRIEYPQ